MEQPSPQRSAKRSRFSNRLSNRVAPTIARIKHVWFFDGSVQRSCRVNARTIVGPRCQHNEAIIGQTIGQIIVPCIRFRRPVGPTIWPTIVPCKRRSNRRRDSCSDRSARRLYHVYAILVRRNRTRVRLESESADSSPQPWTFLSSTKIKCCVLTGSDWEW